MSVFTGDQDDYDALQRTVQKIVAENKLASHVSVHVMNAVTSFDLPSKMFCIWPTPKTGYRASHLFNIQKHIREHCRDNDIALIGHSTDSAGFSQSLAKKVMVPQPELIEAGVMYLGLGIEEEQYLAPYFWQYPTIMYLDFEHNQRSAMRQLNYDTLDLVMYEEGDVTIKVTMTDLHNLRVQCEEKNVELLLSENDIKMVKYLGINSDAAYKIFNQSLVSLLEEHVPHSVGTVIYITMIEALMSPFTTILDPVSVVENVSKGLTIMRLWKKWLELKKIQLYAKAGAAKNSKLRGHFITRQTYDSLEIQGHAAILHQLALFQHSVRREPAQATPRRASTITTERFIGQMQSKTNHIQDSCRDVPSVAECIGRASRIQHSISTLHNLEKDNVKIKPSSNRKKTISKDFTEKTTLVYKYPNTYRMFQEELIKAYRKGVQLAQEILKTKLPTNFSACLEEASAWKTPYSFEYNCKLIEDAPDYDLIHLSPAFVADDKEDEKGDDDLEPEAEGEDRQSMEEDNGKSEELGEANEAEKKEEEENVSVYINRQGKEIHIAAALKMTLGAKDIISKDRHKRHWVSNKLKSNFSLSDQHEIKVLKFYAVKTKRTFSVIQLTDIKEDGKQVQSAERLSKTVITGVILDVDEKGMITRSKFPKLCKWTASKAIIGEVFLMSSVDGFNFSEESRKFLEKKGYISCHGDVAKPNGEAIEVDAYLKDDHYEVEKILSSRINAKSHNEEYLVKFKGYPDSENTWLGADMFNQPVEFTTTSKSGRKRRHRTRNDNPGEAYDAMDYDNKTAERNEDSDFDDEPVQPRKKRKSRILISLPSSEEENNSSETDEELLRSQMEPVKKNMEVEDTISGDLMKDMQRLASPWGGCTSNGIKLINTCTIDNVLSALALEYSWNEAFRTEVEKLATTDNVCRCLLSVFQDAASNNWDVARLRWMKNIVGKNVVRSTMDCWGAETQVVSHIETSALCRNATQKNTNCTACGKRCKNVAYLQMQALLGRWCRDEPEDASSQTRLPIEQILNRAYSKEGCPGLCSCKAPAIVSFNATVLPKLFAFYIADFIALKEGRRYNNRDSLQLKVDVTLNGQIRSYEMRCVTVSQPGHFRSLLFVKGHWFEYNPFRHGHKKVSRNINDLQIKDGEQIQTVLYIQT